MPQSHHTSGSRTGCSWAVLSKANIARPLLGPARAPCGAVQILPPRTRSFNVCIESLRASYGYRNHKPPGNSPCGDHKGHVRVPCDQIRRLYGIFSRSGCVNSLACPQVCRTAPCWSHTGPIRIPSEMKNIEYLRAGPIRCPCGHRTGYPCSSANNSTKP